MKTFPSLAAFPALALSAVSLVAHAAGWQKTTLSSEEGVRVNLDYVIAQQPFNGCHMCTFFSYTSPLWINVEAAGLDASDAVRVVLVNNMIHQNLSDLNGSETRQLDLVYAEDGRFTVDAGSLNTGGSGYGGNVDFTLEVAVVVNGEWLKDPVSKTSNFKVELPRE